MRKKLYKIGMIFCVMNFIGIAVALFLAANLGSDSIGLLCDGLHRVLGISFGNASLLYNLAIIALACCIARNHLGLGTIVYALVSGYFIDFYSFLFAPLHLAEQNLLLRVLGFAVGQCFLSAGLAILIQMKLGMNAQDAVIYKIQDSTKIPYAVMRTGCDISYVVIGTLLGGTFGIGTICSVLLTGTMVSKITQIISKTNIAFQQVMTCD